MNVKPALCVRSTTRTLVLQVERLCANRCDLHMLVVDERVGGRVEGHIGVGPEGFQVGG